MKNCKAVITGDIICSRRIDVVTRQQLFLGLKDFISSLPNVAASESARGDWFQCILKNHKYVLRDALLIKFYLRTFQNRHSIYDLIDARIGIGIGSIDFLADSVGISDGIAFQLSGQALDSMKKGRRRQWSLSLGMEIPAENEKLYWCFSTILTLVDAVTKKATFLQSQILFKKLQGESYLQISKELGIPRSKVMKQYVSAGGKPLEVAIKTVANELRTIDLI